MWEFWANNLSHNKKIKQPDNYQAGFKVHRWDLIEISSEMRINWINTIASVYKNGSKQELNPAVI